MPAVPITRAVFFDLDGTFADTAPDLCYALNLMREARRLTAVPLAATRPVTSSGARGMLSVGFNLAPEDENYQAMREEFLRLYEANLCRESRLFSGISELIARLQERGIGWGIVTNKAERYAKPLIRMLAPNLQCLCIIGGDTTGHLKPHPAPLLAASAIAGAPPRACMYVGDDARDIQAGRAAGMTTVAVRYGYLNGSTPDSWGADAVIDHPEDLLQVLGARGT